MKKVLLLLAALPVVALALPMNVSAATPKAQTKTEIKGIVRNNGTAVKAAKVTVICNGSVKKDLSDDTGKYFVQYGETACPDGASVSVQSVKGKKGGYGTGTVSNQSATVNMAVVDINVPEFGLITGAAGLAAAGGLFMLTRRRASDVA